MRLRNADSSSKSIAITKIDASPATDHISSGSNPNQSQKHKSLASASTTNSAKRKTPGRPRTKVVTIIPNLEEKLEAAEKVEEPKNVNDVNEDNIESEKEGEQSFGYVGLSNGRELKSMEVDEPVVGKVCELIEKEKSMVDVEQIVSHNAFISFERPGHTIVDLNISVPDNKDYTGANEGGEELKEEELIINGGEKGKEELKPQEGEKGKDELKEQEGEKGKDELNEQKKEQEMEEFKVQKGEKGKEELKEWEEDKGKEELKQQKGEKEKEELKEHEGKSPKSGELIDLGEQGRVKLDDEDPEEDLEEDPEEALEEPPQETETLDEERMELEAIAKQQKINKEHEIFIGGLNRDTTEEDLRKAFQRIGDIVEVRLNKKSSTNKNEVYAFVKFGSKEHVKKALSEMKNPVIRGKRCGTSPSEDNDRLFLGNICNTWTKDDIKQKLKDYGVEGVENITLIPDVQRESLSRGFAFLEFSCHGDAMLAYKRLQKPDVVFGHTERTAKVAFAEPIREPDPNVMAQVKSVFINSLPLHWDEDHVRELLKSYGEIVRIALARNMSTTKKKDYGFVDFSTHEAALACVDGVNKSELGDETSKIKVKARLSKPLPKTQIVKGGMCGGFRIGQARSGAHPRSRRGFRRGRGRQPFNNRGNFNRDRSFNHHGGHNQIGRMGFRDDPDFRMHPDFHQRQFGPQGPMRGGHYSGSRGVAAFVGASRHYNNKAWYGILDGGPGELIPPRRPYSPGGQFDVPFMERHIDDPYLYDDNMRGIKRPFYMTDPEPDYMGPNRLRPQFDYPDPSIFQETRYHDYSGVGSRQYPHDYYGLDHGGGPYSSFYGGEGPHRHRYYY